MLFIFVIQEVILVAILWHSRIILDFCHRNIAWTDHRNTSRGFVQLLGKGNMMEIQSV